jgi:GMP synthase-like glutamine amidotransferase
MSRNGTLRALIIEHERATPGGRVYDWLEAHGAEIDELRIDIEPPDLDPGEYDVIIPLGSEHAAYADHVAWIPPEVDLLRQAHESGASVLGICFGGQLLARALGGRCYRAERSEIGWLPIRTRNPELVSQGPWFQWHFDTFDAPPGSTLLAESDVGPQAFSIGQSFGVQFHPEVTPQMMEDWVRVYRHELDEEGVDPDALLVETYELAEQAASRSRMLLDTFLERVARVRGGGA